LENKLLKSIEPWVNTAKSGLCRNVLSNRLTKSHLHILHLILANLIMFLKPFSIYRWRKRTPWWLNLWRWLQKNGFCLSNAKIFCQLWGPCR